MKTPKPALIRQTRAEEVLRDIAQGISTVTDEAFFISLVQHLAQALDVEYAFIGQLNEELESDPNHQAIQTVAMWAEGKLADNFQYQPMPPCLRVLRSFPVASFPSDVQQQFPDNPWLHDWRLESYIGISLRDTTGHILGLMAVMDTRPIENSQLAESILQIFAVRAAAELARKRSEVTLRASEARYRAISQLIFAYAYAFRVESDGALMLEWMTESVAEVTGFTLPEIKAHGWRRLIYPDDLLRVEQQLQHTAATGQSTDSEYRFVTKSGNIRWLRSHTQAIWGETQTRVVQILGAAHDITEHKQAQTQLQALNTDLERQVQERTAQLQREMQKLQELNQLKDDFLSTVSHELRTPLTNMKMAIHMLQLHIGEVGCQPHYLKILQAECQREMELINDLLDLQRVETDTAPGQLNNLNFEAWLPQITEPFLVRAHQQQQKLTIHVEPNLPKIVADSNHLKRIVAELLNNACKYTPEGGEIAMTVSLASMTPSQIEFVLTVSNQADIPPAERVRIFDKFYRIPSADRWKQGGTGLGLALIKKLTERLGGQISVDCKAGWTHFSVSLPQGP